MRPGYELTIEYLSQMLLPRIAHRMHLTTNLESPHSIVNLVAVREYIVHDAYLCARDAGRNRASSFMVGLHNDSTLTLGHLPL